MRAIVCTLSTVLAVLAILAGTLIGAVAGTVAAQATAQQRVIQDCASRLIQQNTRTSNTITLTVKNAPPNYADYFRVGQAQDDGSGCISQTFKHWSITDTAPLTLEYAVGAPANPASPHYWAAQIRLAQDPANAYGVQRGWACYLGSCD